MPYRIVLADPPWSFNDKLRMDPFVDRGSDDNYDTMPVNEICTLSTADRRIAGFEVDDPAVLFLWITNSFLLDGSGTRVARAWGFEPKQIITWVKTKKSQEPETVNDLQFGMDRITRGVTEHVIVATRGKYFQPGQGQEHSQRHLCSTTRALP